MVNAKPIVCVDFDGVLNTYDGWRGEDELFKPRLYAKAFLDLLSEEYYVVIFTTRNHDKVVEWLDKYDMYYDDVTDIKVGAVAYIDDRAIKFNGLFGETLNELRDFKTHWEKEK